ncbi:hypothetical protein AAG906_000405 [Vitis piasezkii]
MHGSITRASVHSCRWNKSRIWGESKPSEYQSDENLKFYSVGFGFCDVCVDQGFWMLLQEKVELNWDKMDENDTVKGHTILCNEVRSINADSSPGPEVYNALLFLGMSSLLATTDILYPSSRGALIGLCRPLNQAEMANGSTSIVDFDSSRENELQIICSDSLKKQFKFDHVFRPGSDQEALFAQTSPIVTSMLVGYNVCIFAYGQTGT